MSKKTTRIAETPISLDSFRGKTKIAEFVTHSEDEKPDTDELIEVINKRFNLNLKMEIFDGVHEEYACLWELSIPEEDGEVIERLRKESEDVEKRQETIRKLLKEKAS